MTNLEWVVQAIVTYMRTFPNDPEVIRLRRALDDLDEAARKLP